MEKEIKERIEELEKEIKEHQSMVTKQQQSMGILKTTIISKCGAVIELKKLIVEKKDGKDGL